MSILHTAGVALKAMVTPAPHYSNFVDVIVPKGTHHVLRPPILRWTHKNQLGVIIKTDKSWRQSFMYHNRDDRDWSKLTGIYWGFVHRNSARAVIRRTKAGVWKIGGYVYSQGETPWNNGTLQATIWEGYVLPKTLRIVCGWEDYEYFVSVNGSRMSLKTLWHPELPIAGLSMPYFGGDNGAWKDWIIKMKMINPHK